MSDLRLYLFDDARARRWAPFTLTRPVGELLFGTRTLRGQAELRFGATCLGHVTRRALQGFDEPGAAPGVALDEVAGEGTRVLVSSRAALDAGDPPSLDRPARLTLAGEPCGWIVPPGEALPTELWIRDPSSSAPSGSDVELGGTLLGRPWDLIEHNARRIAEDVGLWPERGASGGTLIGDGLLSLGPGAIVEEGVTVDTRGGPVILDEDVVVQGPGRLIGPLYVGPGTQIYGGRVGRSSFGPECRIRGEVTTSVVSGFSNKAHDGFLGHSLLGRWVNLGAMTTNSNLKNNYGSVRVWTPDGEVDTGLAKIGCMIGDHVKTGIGTLLNTGTVVGAGSNLFGGRMPPTAVPAFSWGAGAELGVHRLEKFLETAERAMSRRDVSLTAGLRGVLERAWHSTAGQRAP